jgi:hypothetical protein
MMRLSVGLIGLFGWLAVAPGAFTQEQNLKTVPSGQSQSELLSTEPRSIDQLQPQSRTAPTQNLDQFNDISKSIQANPTKQSPEETLVPGNLPLKEILRTPSRRPSDVNGIDFFQVPGPSPSLGINLNKL